MSINKVVKTIIEGEGISQKKFAEIIGVSDQLVSKWVHGSNLPTEKGLCKIIMSFRAYNPYWIISGQGNPDNTQWEDSSSECKSCLEKDRTIAILQDHITTLKEQNELLKDKAGIQSKVS